MPGAGSLDIKIIIYTVISNSIHARLKYTIRLTASTIVVINGPAMIAGSIFNTFAAIGNVVKQMRRGKAISEESFAGIRAYHREKNSR